MKSFDQIKFEYFLKRVRKTEDYDKVFEYVKKHKKLSDEKLFQLTYLVCDSKEPYYLVEFAKVSEIKNLHCLNSIARILAETDSIYYINHFIDLFPELKANQVLVNRLCELNSIDRLLESYIDSDAVYMTDEVKKNVVSTIIKNGSQKQIGELARHYDSLTQEERDSLIVKTCKSLDGRHINLVSFYFAEEDKTPFVNAICRTKNAEMIHCFLVTNELDYNQVEKIVLTLCEINNTEYVYKALLELGNEYSNLRKMLLQNIKEADNPKYMMLAAVYSDKEYLIKKIDFVQNLYEKAVMSEGIFTDAELVGMYKHIQKTKAESYELIKCKRGSK